MSKTIFERIELEKRGKEPNEVIELNLDNCRGLAEVDEELSNSLNKFDNMECLSLINANLSAVKSFPTLNKLRKLELSDNRISGGLDIIAKNCPLLTHLSLSGNKIADYEALRVLSSLKHLRSLDLFNCEVTHLDEYREKVFQMLPELEFLDGYDRDDKEDVEDDEYGEADGEVDGDGDADDAEVEVDDDDDDDDLDDDDDDDDDEVGEEEAVGLDYLQKDNLELDSEGEDFNPEDEDDDEDVTVEDGEDDDLEQQEDDDEQSRGKKRKHDGEEEDGAA